MTSIDEPISDELTRFREQWRQEVESRTRAAHDPQPSSSSDPPPPQPRRSPVDIYAEAVEKEQRGELDVALDLYRRAFRLDPNVDRVYHLQTATAALTLAPITRKPTADKPSVPTQIHVPATSAHSVRTLIAAFPPASELAFAPELEQEPVYLARIPDEILLHVLKLLDVPTIERFATICRRARVLTLDPDLWRDFVVSTYVPPQIPVDASIGDIITGFKGDTRRLYIELPRLRLDGVYIAVCHYVRPGQSENAWVNVDHLVTYHRYLRFLPDGRVLSLLDQTLPAAEAVKILVPTLRLKGFFIGTWSLTTPPSISASSSKTPSEAPRVMISALTDPSGAFPHSFQMELTLGSKPLGRWNRLTIDSYTSLDPTGQPSPLPIRNERPFWFSKVRSWA